MALIAIIEDDKMLAEIYEISLEAAGFQAEIAHDGKAGLELIKKSLPDLVLLDIMMPIMSGDQVLKHMRESTWGKDIPVVMATNISESEAPDELMKLKFERFLIKANNSPKQIIEIIKEILDKKTA